MNTDTDRTRRHAVAAMTFSTGVIIANNYFRPRNAAVAAKYAGQFAKVPMFTIDKNFGGWAQAQKNHFADGGTFDQIYAAAKR